jgi:hypothetical protein
MSAMSGTISYPALNAFQGASPGPGGGQGPNYPGYAQILQSVLQGLQGVGQSQGQAIQDVYAQQQGNTNQQMQSSGLANSTVGTSLQRGNLLDEQKAQIALQNQLAQTAAGYSAQLGTEGLQSQQSYQQQQIQHQQQMQTMGYQEQLQQQLAQFQQPFLGYQRQQAGMMGNQTLPGYSYNPSNSPV